MDTVVLVQTGDEHTNSTQRAFLLPHDCRDRSLSPEDKGQKTFRLHLVWTESKEQRGTSDFPGRSFPGYVPKTVSM